MVHNKEVYAVAVRNGRKSYGNFNVLNGVNMFVPEGCLYALLGPSGSGKTILLNIISGQSFLDSGQMLTTGILKHNIGYMPQETALNTFMSVTEVFNYFGHIYGMKRQELLRSSHNICSLLDLQTLNKKIGLLSDGEQRRVSLAIALIHDPDLLILDEPTVGVDPILRKRIWDHLQKLTFMRKKTTIITTHYIEEARLANKVGLIRHGRILIEDTPNNIMEKCNASTLDEAFIQLCFQQDNLSPGKTDNRSLSIGGYLQGMNQRLGIEETKPKRGGRFLVSHFTAELMKNIIVLWRNKPMLAFQIGTPFFMCLLWCSLFGNFQNIKLGIVNEEINPNSTRCPRKPLFLCTRRNLMSCNFIEMLHNHFEMVYYSSHEEGEIGEERNEIHGLIYFPENYTDSLLKMMDEPLITDGITIEHSKPAVSMNRLDPVLRKYIEQKTIGIYKEFLESFDDRCGWSWKAFYPISFQDPIYGTRTHNFGSFSAGTFMIMILYFQGMTYTLSVVVDENSSGLLRRGIVTGLTMLEVFSAQFVIQSILLLVQTFEEWFVIFFLYQTVLLGNFISFFCLLYLQGLAGSLCGFFIASIIDSSKAASFILVFSSYALGTISGLLWPEEGMHPVLKMFSWMFPLNYSSKALQSIMVKGWGISNPTVFIGFISTLLWILFFGTAVIISIKINNYLKHKK